MDKKFKIDLNPEFLRALNIIENTKRNVFITGRAGTGKSTLLEYYREQTKKKIVVLAPTGVAALNVKGQTVHSFFGFKPNITLGKVRRIKNDIYKKAELYKTVDAIVIDEISMVRADILDCVEKFMRLNGKNPNAPFGGAQMIFIGDLYQLPPVVTDRDRQVFGNQYASPYFFSAKVFSSGALFNAALPMDFIELEKVYRQKDNDFVALLNSIRNNSAEDKEIRALNQRYNSAFDPSNKDCYIYLTSTNDAAKEINERKLQELKGKEYIFQAEIRGKFDKSYYPTDDCLTLKTGAQVMMLNNDSARRWVNGTIGQVVGVVEAGPGDKVIKVKLTNGEVEEVLPHEWDIFSYEFNRKKGQIDTDTVGSFTQYPLKLAWAVTIHKSQGKTFDKVIVDVGRGTFAHGQMYVALSRCTTLAGLVLKRLLEKRHILMDWRVVEFVTKYQYGISEKNCSLANKTEILTQAIVNKRPVKIVYLKNNDIKSKRQIMPTKIGELEYAGKTFFGLEAFCLTRQENRVFRVDRILEIEG